MRRLLGVSAIALVTACHPLRVRRDGHTAATLVDGGVLVVGGANSYPPHRLVGRFDPEKERWRSVAALAVGRKWHAATTLVDGRVLVTGGTDHTADALASTVIYDPAADRWSDGPTMTRPRWAHEAVRLADGRVLVIGGDGGASAEVWDPRGSAWRSVTAPPWAGRISATLLADGRVLVVGEQATALVYDAVADAWAETGPVVVPRAFHTATRVEDGRVLVVGGRAFAGDATLASTEWFDPRRLQWTVGPPLRHERSAHTATLVDSRVVVIGGRPGAAGGERAVEEVEVLDVANGQWRDRGVLRKSRWDHTASRLTDGSIIVVGGQRRVWFNNWYVAGWRRIPARRLR